MQSRVQNAFMHWAAANPGVAQRQIDPKVARKFIADSHGQRVRDLPERVTQKADGGVVRTGDGGYPPRFSW